MGRWFVLALLVVARRGDAKVFDVAHCATDVGSSANIVALDDVPAERGTPPRELDRIARLDTAARATEARAIEAMFPASWNAHVELDATGMAHVLAIELPRRTKTVQLVAPALAFVRAHACLFGIADPTALVAHVGERRLLFDRAPHTVGSLSAMIIQRSSTTIVRFEGHLWPVVERQVAAPKLTRYLGRDFVRSQFEPHPFPGDAPDTVEHRRTVTVRDLTTAPGPLLVCSKRTVDVTAGIYVELAGTAGGDRTLAELPAALDPRTGRPVTGAWVMPVLVEPGAGAAYTDRANAPGRTCLDVPFEPSK